MPKSKQTGTLKAQPKKNPSKAPKPKRELTPEEKENLRLKMEAAQALGLWDKVNAEGWGALTAAESARVGGWMTRVRFQAKRQGQSAPIPKT